MYYARCLYRVVICADARERSAFPITRSTLDLYVRHVCNLVGCELVALSAGSGIVHLLVDVGVAVPIDSFVKRLRIWTSSWISGREGCCDYWLPTTLVTAISPEDKEPIKSMIATPLTDQGAQSYYKYCEHDPALLPPARHCHHIIIITSRARLLLPLKRLLLLINASKEVSNEMGCEVVETSARRNHVHLLCKIPPERSLPEVIEEYKRRLYQWMQSNKYFRKIDWWSEKSVVFTLSPDKIHQEEYLVARQEMTHGIRTSPWNEMALISRRLGIDYFVSLN